MILRSSLFQMTDVEAGDDLAEHSDNTVLTVRCSLVIIEAKLGLKYTSSVLQSQV
jgi:hypothetical protein